MQLQRISVVVLDGVGVGEAPDAADYGDVGSNSVGNTARVLGGLHLPHLGKIGLGNITEVAGVPPRQDTSGAYGRCEPQSAGKDTISGHWEMMGICLRTPFPTYPNGFSEEVVSEFEERAGVGTLGNYPASGTVIIKDLGLEHMATGKPIIYTSADSVFQIAAHEEIIPIEELYRLCEIAREILVGEHSVGRVIARPFLGQGPEDFWRTERRRDFPLRPESDTMLDKVCAAGKQVYSIGKIDDIFGHRGITKKNHTTNNQQTTQALLDALEEDFEGLVFANLIEFDMVYGHRNDPQGYYNALKDFDGAIPQINQRLRPTDMVIVTGDHGVDPTTESTDHSREYVPLLVFGPSVRGGVDLGIRGTLSDIAATIAEAFSLQPPELGKSFLSEVLKP